MSIHLECPAKLTSIKKLQKPSQSTLDKTTTTQRFIGIILATLKLGQKIPIVPKGLYPRPDLLTLWTSNRIRALGSNQDVLIHLVER
jgi:hypothetical protein